MNKTIKMMGLVLGAALLSSTPLFADQEVGNGGDALVCYPRTNEGITVRDLLIKRLRENRQAEQKKNPYVIPPFDDPKHPELLNMIESVRSYDLYIFASSPDLSFNRAKLISLPLPNKNPNYQERLELVKRTVDRIIHRLSERSSFGVVLKRTLDAVPMDGPFSKWKLRSGIAEIDDVRHLVMPSGNCVMVQIARFNEKSNEVELDGPLFHKMIQDPSNDGILHTVGLVLHELFKKIAVGAGHKTSDILHENYLVGTLMLADEFFEQLDFRKLNTQFESLLRKSEPALFWKVRFQNQEIWMKNVSYYPNGAVKSGELREAREFQIGQDGVPFKDTLSFYENGMIEAGTLAGEVYVPILNSPVKFKDQISLHPNGKVKKGILVGEEELNITYRRIPFKGEVSFHPNGDVESGTLAREEVFRTYHGDIKFRDRINFYPTGKVWEGALAEETALEIPFPSRPTVIKLMSHSGVQFDEKGRFLSGRLKDEVEVPMKINCRYHENRRRRVRLKRGTECIDEKIVIPRRGVTVYGYLALYPERVAGEYGVVRNMKIAERSVNRNGSPDNFGETFLLNRWFFFKILNTNIFPDYGAGVEFFSNGMIKKILNSTGAALQGGYEWRWETVCSVEFYPNGIVKRVAYLKEGEPTIGMEFNDRGDLMEGTKKVIRDKE